MSRWALILVLLLQFRLIGQELTASEDGSQVYFTTTLNVKGAPAEVPYNRLFRAVGKSIELVADAGPGPNRLPIYGIALPQVSRDGKVLAFNRVGVCVPSRVVLAPLCVPDVTLPEVRGKSIPNNMDGTVHLSPNGRWALVRRGFTIPGLTVLTLGSGEATLIDLETGEKRSVEGVASVHAPVANDGTVLIHTALGPALWKSAQITSIGISGLSTGLWGISDDATTLLYDSYGLVIGANAGLIARDIRSGSDRVIAPVVFLGGLPRFLDHTPDGHYVLFLRPPAANPFFLSTSSPREGRAYVSNTRTGEVTPLAAISTDRFTAGAISGDGRTVFLLSRTNAIVKVDVARPDVLDTVVPATPYLRPPQIVAPGSYTLLTPNVPMSRETVAGRIHLDGVPLAVLGVSEQGVAVQIPWETLPNQDHVLQVDMPSESPFRQNEILTVRPAAGGFLTNGASNSTGLPFVAVRADFSGVLTEPPKPGETFIVYATGLGPVDGPIKTGEPAPTGTPLRIREPITCTFFPYTEPAETLFAGLAPGMVGIYQINFRLPAEPDRGRIVGGSCTYSGGSFNWGIFVTFLVGNILGANP